MPHSLQKLYPKEMETAKEPPLFIHTHPPCFFKLYPSISTSFIQVPDEWKKAIIVPLDKGKRSKDEFNNYRDNFV